jgi:hypothetical protein
MKLGLPARSGKMALDFPNSIRRYEAGRQCISFWGSDGSLEVAFQVNLDALRKLDLAAFDGREASALNAFDHNREAIRNAARAAYRKHPLAFHRLTPDSFR